MDWEEELVLRSRNLKFDNKFIYKLMIDISNKIQKYAKKYDTNINACCVPGDYIDISGNINITIRFIFSDELLTIKLNDEDKVFINIYIKEYYYYIVYTNLPSEDKNYNKSVYFLDKNLFSILLKDLLILNNKS